MNGPFITCSFNRPCIHPCHLLHCQFPWFPWALLWLQQRTIQDSILRTWMEQMCLLRAISSVMLGAPAGNTALLVGECYSGSKDLQNDYLDYSIQSVYIINTECPSILTKHLFNWYIPVRGTYLFCGGTSTTKPEVGEKEGIYCWYYVCGSEGLVFSASWSR